MNSEPVERNIQRTTLVLNIAGVAVGVSVASILTLLIVLTIGVSELNGEAKTGKPQNTTTTTTIATAIPKPPNTSTISSTTVLTTISNTSLANISNATITTTAPIILQ